MWRRAAMAQVPLTQPSSIVHSADDSKLHPWHPPHSTPDRHKSQLSYASTNDEGHTTSTHQELPDNSIAVNGALSEAPVHLSHDADYSPFHPSHSHEEQPYNHNEASAEHNPSLSKQQYRQQLKPVPQRHSEMNNQTLLPKKRRSSRRKPYRCGYCHSLGHNQKTCPDRPPHLGRATNSKSLTSAQIQPIKVSDEIATLFLESAAATCTDDAQTAQHITSDTVLELVNKRITDASYAVASATTDTNYHDAITQLQAAVLLYEKVAFLVRRGIFPAQIISRDTEEPSQVQF